MAVLLFLALAASAAAQQPGAPSHQVQGPERQQGAQETAAVPVATPNAARGRDRQICRRQVRMGTLAGFETVCHTAAEWQEIARGGQASWQQMQGTHGTSNCARLPSQDGPLC